MSATIKNYIQELAREAKVASYQMAKASTEQKNRALNHISDLILSHQEAILSANDKDMALAIENGLDEALLDRLKLHASSVQQMAEGLQQVMALPDPIGQLSEFQYRPSGIQVGKMQVPLGVIGIIYESRPNVTADTAALCIKSGNACLLRGGREAFHSNQAIACLIAQGLKEANLPEHAVRFVEETDRVAVGVMLQSDEWIDVIVPRGGKSLVARIAQEARVPVIKHLEGICHVYIDADANIKEAIEIAVNAKTSRYGTCNTMETLLVHQSVAMVVLPVLKERYQEKGVELKGCEHVRLLLGEDIALATEADWQTEYLAPILSIKIVDDVDEAIRHINHYGSHHTDSIVSEHYGKIQAFLREVDSASVMVNASTRFADGFEYGLGAEIGISTDKIHARGPVGLDGLTSKKWIVLGSGQIRI